MWISVSWKPIFGNISRLFLVATFLHSEMVRSFSRHRARLKCWWCKIRISGFSIPILVQPEYPGKQPCFLESLVGRTVIRLTKQLVRLFHHLRTFWGYGWVISSIKSAKVLHVFMCSYFQRSYWENRQHFPTLELGLWLNSPYSQTDLVEWIFQGWWLACTNVPWLGYRSLFIITDGLADPEW